MQSWREQPAAFFVFILPATLWLLAFFLIPLALIWVISFGERVGPVDIAFTWTSANYLDALDPLYLKLFWRSLWIAAVATAVVLVVAFPVAFAIAFAPPRAKPLLLLLVVLPFWTNMLIRTYAMLAVLRGNGYLNWTLEGLWEATRLLLTPIGLGWLTGERFVPLELLYNNTAVVFGIVYVYLPFMVLPLYASLERLDRSLLEASLDLGASQLRTFLAVVVPMARPGIVSGLMLVFIPAIGTFLISDLLGGPDSQLLGNIIERQFKAANNWPLGAAMSFLLLYVAFALLLVRAWLGARGLRDA
ncbi:MAG: ABC transporter permease subunit [Alphaproteobacteria bacterium]|nr:ABC transporter permease subunit [Alphaproteobacteria bacterium]